MIGFPLSVICSGHPIDLNKPHILAEDPETVFYDLKIKFLLKYKIKYQWSNAKGRPFDLYYFRHLLVFAGQFF
jgi:hypothetical protein